MHAFRRTSLTLLLSLAALAGCGEGASTQDAAELGTRTGALLGPGESMRQISYTVDAAGNQTDVTEYAAGIHDQADGQSASVASVIIKTVIPASNASGSCITSTIQEIQALPGWTTTVERSGGCDREIRVNVENRTTGLEADFSFLMIFGKTRIDHGLLE